MGIATDVARRFAEHQKPGDKSAKYLRGRGPLTLEFVRPIGEHGRALKLENRIKRLAKDEKEALIRNDDTFAELLQQIDS